MVTGRVWPMRHARSRACGHRQQGTRDRTPNVGWQPWQDAWASVPPDGEHAAHPTLNSPICGTPAPDPKPLQPCPTLSSPTPCARPLHATPKTHLHVRGWVPVGVVQHHAGGARQVDAQAADLGDACVERLGTRRLAAQKARLAQGPLHGSHPHRVSMTRCTLVVSRNTKTSGLRLKSSMRREREATGVQPSMRW